MKTLGLGLLLAGLALTGSGVRAAEPLKVETLLVWGTDSDTSPDPSHKPVDPALAARLGRSPYRWKHYFEVNRQTQSIALNETKKKISMSKRCELDIKNLGNDWVEVRLYGDGKLVSTQREALPLVLAGDAKNDTAWLVVLRKTNAATPESKPPVGQEPRR